MSKSKCIKAIAFVFAAALVTATFSLPALESGIGADASVTKLSVYGGAVEFSPEDFNVSLKADGPIVDDVYGANNNAVYQGRTLQLDAGKKGVLIESVAHGTAAEGISFSLGGEMTGAFSIDFRVFSTQSFEGNRMSTGTRYSDEFNPYLDLKEVKFTFTDLDDTSNVFDVIISGSELYKKATPVMRVKPGNLSVRAYQYNTDSTSWNAADTKKGIQKGEGGYFTSLEGTSFSNTADVGSWVYTEANASTKFSFDPATMKITADRYYRNNTVAAGDRYVSALGTGDNYTQQFNGTCTALKNEDCRLVLDMANNNVMDGYGGVMSGFSRYSCRVTFTDVTADSQAVSVNGESKTYDRYAKMIIYSLNGTPLDGTAAGTDTDKPVVYGAQTKKGLTGVSYAIPSVKTFDSTQGTIDFNGTVSVTDASGNAVSVANGAFIPTTAGEYTITYSGATDAAGNVSEDYSVKAEILSKHPGIEITLNKEYPQTTGRGTILGIAKPSAVNLFSGEAESVKLSVSFNGTGVDGWNGKEIGDDESITLDKEGTYTFVFTAEDVLGGTGEKTVTVVVTKFSVFVYSAPLPELVSRGAIVAIPSATMTLNDNVSDAVVSVTDPKGNHIEITDGSLAVKETGVYTLTYSVESGGETATETKTFRAVRSQTDLISAYDSMNVNENASAPTVKYYGTENDIVTDDGKTGLLLEAKETGTAAEGSSYSFADTMSGLFSIDFRVWSAKTFAGSWGVGGADRYSDEINPYLDLKEVAITVTDADTGKNFTIYVSGAEKYKLCTPVARVQTGTMTEGKGICYNDYRNTVKEIDNAYGYNTALCGASFSNVGCTGSAVSDGGISTKLEFDPADMCVYGYMIFDDEICRIKIRDLSDADQVGGAENVLSGFTRYTVTVTFTDVTDNATQAGGETYERRARMLIYSLNGQKLGYTNGAMTNNSAPVIAKGKTQVQSGESVDMTPFVYDVLDGNIAFNGTVSYIAPDTTTGTVTVKDGRYTFIPDQVGTYTFIYEGNVADSEGLVAVSASTQLISVDATPPAISLNEGVESSVVVAYDKNAAPSVSINDVVATDNGGNVTITFVIDGPDNTGKFAVTGVYTVTYTATDAAGNTSTVSRTIEVKDKTAPVIEVDKTEIRVGKGSTVVIPTATATDDYDSSVLVSVTVNKGDKVIEFTGDLFVADESGEYTITFEAVDVAGNIAEETVKVTVSEEQNENSGNAEEPAPSKSGCRGSIVGAGVLCGTIGIVAAVFVMSKRRKNK